MNKTILIMLNIFFASPVFLINAGKDPDQCSLQNEMLQKLKDNLHLPFKTLAQDSKEAIDQQLETIEQEIYSIKLKLSQPPLLIQEQKNILPGLIETFKEGIEQVQKEIQQSDTIITRLERLRIQNGVMDQIGKLENLYRHINMGKLSKKDSEELSKKAQEEEKILTKLMKKQLLSDGTTLSNAKIKLKKKITNLRKELARLESIMTSNELLVEEATMRYNALQATYQEQYDELKKFASASSSKPLVKSVKVNILNRIQHEIEKARKKGCLIQY